MTQLVTFGLWKDGSGRKYKRGPKNRPSLFDPTLAFFRPSADARSAALFSTACRLRQSTDDPLCVSGTACVWLTQRLDIDIDLNKVHDHCTSISTSSTHVSGDCFEDPYTVWLNSPRRYCTHTALNCEPYDSRNMHTTGSTSTSDLKRDHDPRPYVVIRTATAAGGHAELVIQDAVSVSVEVVGASGRLQLVRRRHVRARHMHSTPLCRI